MTRVLLPQNGCTVFQVVIEYYKEKLAWFAQDGFQTYGGHYVKVEPRSNDPGSQFAGLQSLASSNGFEY